jgi:hypothetical protein
MASRNRLMSTQSFPYRKLTIIPLLTGGLVGLFLLLMSGGSGLVHPHGGLILFVFVFIGLTVAGLIFVPLGAVQAIRY